MKESTPDRTARRGPLPLPKDAKRTHCVSVRLNDAELQLLERKRGAFQRGEWLRMAALDRLPPAPPPEINREAWAALAKVAGNLATVARALGRGDRPRIEACRAAVEALRTQLLTRPFDDPDEDGEADEPPSGQPG